MLRTLMSNKTYFLIGFVFITTQCFCQNQPKADSLINVLESGQKLSDSVKIELLREVMVNHTDQDAIITYGAQAYELAKKLDDPLWCYKILIEIGYAYKLKGDLEHGLDAFLEALTYVKESGNSKQEAILYNAIAGIYRVQQDYSKTLKFYNQAISGLRQANDSITLAGTLMNTGEFYRVNHELDTAIFYFKESGEIYKNINYLLGTAYNLGNIGLVYAEQGKHELAEKNINAATEILTELGDLYPIAVYDTYMADIYKEKGDMPRALAYASNSLSIAIKNGLKEQIRDANMKLSELYELNKDFENAYIHQSQYLIYRDSINNEETIRKMADLRTAFEVSQKQIEVDLLNKEKQRQRIIAIALIVVLILIGTLTLVLYRTNQIRKRVNHTVSSQRLEMQKQRDQLNSLNATKDRFFSIISHDLRGPVNSIMGISEVIKMLVMEGNKNELIEMGDHIEKSAKHLYSLLDNLLKWAISQQGQFPYKPEKLQLKELADETLQVLANIAASKKINLLHDIDSNLLIWADKNSFQTIIRNLLSNALKFTEEGGEVKLSAKAANDFVVVNVIDNGVGITEQKMKNLFHLDNKKSTWGTSGEKGVGLGLSLAAEFAQLNHGSISAESEEGMGSIFTIQIPLFTDNRTA